MEQGDIKANSTPKMIAEEKERNRSDNANYQKKLRERSLKAKNFEKFLEERPFNLKVYQLLTSEGSTPPTPKQIKNHFGDISEVEVESFCFEILPKHFKKWGKANDYAYQMKVLGMFRGIEE